MNHFQMLQSEPEQALNLPVISPSISNLLKILNNDDISYSQLAVELEKYPSIAIKIVATANSAWASPVAPITTLRDSCARIGVPVVRSISIALSIAQVFDPVRCSVFDPKIYWLSALLTAEAATICTIKQPEICTDTARLAGLLHNIGLLWLASQRPVETANAIILKNSGSHTLSEGLTAELGMDMYQAGGYLTSHIELPGILGDIIASPSTGTMEDELLMESHNHALLLAFSVLDESGSENTDTRVLEDDSKYIKLASKLPEMKALVQALFL